jgi:putative PIN family toxin of toxin-antitoxin system
LHWLIEHWQGANCIPLISVVTAAEVTRVLSYPKFKLSTEIRYEFLADYIPFCEVVEIKTRCAAPCRDPRDQPFLDLAQSAQADVLVSGDADLLVLAGQTKFAIETPAAYWRRVCPK